MQTIPSGSSSANQLPIFAAFCFTDAAGASLHQAALHGDLPAQARSGAGATA